MILRRITQHVKAQNWFAVGLDFLIVIVGILIAFQITNWGEERAAHAKLSRVEEVLQVNLRFIYFNAKQRLSLAECRAQVFQSIAQNLLAPGDGWEGMPRSDSNNDFKQVLTPLLRSPHRPWEAQTWEAELAQGTFNIMDDERRELLNGIFRQVDLAKALQNDIFALQGRLKVLAVSTDIPRDSRLRYYDILGELDDKSGLLELIAEQIIKGIETVGVNTPVDRRQLIIEGLSSAITRARETYGACYVSPRFAAYDWLPDNEAAQ